MLVELLRHTDTKSVLVFTRTKHRAKKLGEKLGRTGFKATSLQGNLSQKRRQAALDGFRNGTFQILVATDVAARGIDVTRVSHVINYDIPDTADAYIHRIGRTGRAARNGDAFTLVTGNDKAMVRAIEQMLGSRMEHRTVDGFNFSGPAPRNHIASAEPLNQRSPRHKPSMAKRAGKQQRTAPGSGRKKSKACIQRRQRSGRTARASNRQPPPGKHSVAPTGVGRSV
jgi:ATP-dependent RNA helicase RhlE